MQHLQRKFGSPIPVIVEGADATEIVTCPALTSVAPEHGDAGNVRWQLGWILTRSARKVHNFLPASFARLQNSIRTPFIFAIVLLDYQHVQRPGFHQAKALGVSLLASRKLTFSGRFTGATDPL